MNDYLHYYIGQPCLTSDRLFKKPAEGTITGNLLQQSGFFDGGPAGRVKLILRRLHSITKEEALELLNILWYPTSKQKIMEVRPKQDRLWSGTAYYFSWLEDELCMVLDIPRHGIRLRRWSSAYQEVIDIPIYNIFNATEYLLKKGFWLFGDEHFDSGEIIDEAVHNKKVLF